MESREIFHEGTLETILIELKNEYEKELDRADKLSNKSNAVMTVVIAVLAIYIPVIPFKTIKTIFIRQSGKSFWFLVAGLLLFLLALVLLIAAFYLFHRVIEWADYQRINYDNFQDGTIQKAEKKLLLRGLIAHYGEIIANNDRINREKEKRMYYAITIASVAVIMLSVAVGIILIAAS